MAFSKHRYDLMTSSNANDPNDVGSLDLNGMRVLIVEDSWDVGTGLKTLLEAWGAHIAGPVATAADAMQLASGSSLDVALVDINLRHGEQSYGLLDWLHERRIRVVVLSGYADVSVAKDKVVAVLQKPVREELLLASLRSPSLEKCRDGENR